MPHIGTSLRLVRARLSRPEAILRVLEKELVEIPEPKEQQRISRHAGAQPLILLHHRGEGMSHGGRMKLKEEEMRASNFRGQQKAQHFVSKVPGVSSGDVLLSHNL